MHLLPPLSGLLLAWSFPSYHLYPLAWVALIPLFIAAIKSPTVWRNAACFFVAGWFFHSLVLQWLISNIYWGGGWAVIGYQLLCVILGVCWAIAGFVWGWARQRTPCAGAAALGVLWIWMEWCQASLFSGFGWSALGYSQGKDFTLAQCAALGGVSSISFLLVMVNALIALAVVERRRRIARIVVAGVVLISGHLIGYAVIGPADYASKPLTAGLFQSNFPQEMKWDREYTREMVEKAAEHSQVLSEQHPVHCFFWPEALVMADYSTPELMQPMADLVKRTGAHLFTGATREAEVRGSVRSYNSSMLLTPEGTVAGYYDKVHLAPFGEYMPFASIFPFLRHITPIDVDPGSEQKIMAMGDRRLGPLICFEVLFTPLVENLRRLGADTLVVVTNLGWFGRSNAIPQELELARFRAIESRLPLIHAANSGISGVFDPWGRFESVNALLYQDQYHEWPKEHIEDPSMFIMERCMGALKVAAPARRPIPGGPAVFPWLCIGMAVLLLLAARFKLGAAQTHTQETSVPATGNAKKTKR